MGIYFVKKIIVALILPPGVFIVVFACGGIYSLNRHKKFAFLLLSSALGLYLISIDPFSNILMRAIEVHEPLNEGGKGDVIIMLGGGVHNGILNLSEKSYPLVIPLERVVCSFLVWKKLHVPIVVTGDSESSNAPAETEIMKRNLIDLGVPATEILEERNSRNTYENSLHVSQLLAKKGFKKPIVVTSAYHMKRAELCFKKLGVNIVPLPCGATGGKTGYSKSDFLPNVDSLQVSTKILKEYIGIIFYKIIWMMR